MNDFEEFLSKVKNNQTDKEHLVEQLEYAIKDDLIIPTLHYLLQTSYKNNLKKAVDLAVSSARKDREFFKMKRIMRREDFLINCSGSMISPGNFKKS